jgi:hypothetical protein
MMRKKRRCSSAYEGKRHIKECPLRLDVVAIDDAPGQLVVVRPQRRSAHKPDTALSKIAQDSAALEYEVYTARGRGVV